MENHSEKELALYPITREPLVYEERGTSVEVEGKRVYLTTDLAQLYQGRTHGAIVEKEAIAGFVKPCVKVIARGRTTYFGEREAWAGEDYDLE